MKKIILLIVLMPLFMTTQAQNSNGNILNEGDNLPEFNIDNGIKRISTHDLKGKVVLINFFATWCGPCLAELPVLQQKIYETYKNRPDFELLVIGREHSNSEIVTFASTKKLTLPFFGDPKREVYGLFAVNTIPRNVLIDKTGKIVYMGVGYSEESFNYLLEVLAKELAK